MRSVLPVPPHDQMPPTIVSVARGRWSNDDGKTSGERALPQETPVAIVHDASTTAVMLATPADLEDFAVGFSLTESVIDGIADIRGLEIVRGDLGVEARMWLSPGHAERLATRRRRLLGPTGCGLCGIDSLAEAVRLPKTVATDDLTIAPRELLAAMEALGAAQTLGHRTRAVHAAGFWGADHGLVASREDVGRHNALDKLVGALARSATPPLGVVLLTSRVSVEMVQKAAAFGAPILCAVSAPTALAVHTAQAAGITLIAVARRDGFEVFTHPGRVRA